MIKEFLKVFFISIIFIMGLSFIVRTIQQADMFNGRWDMFFENEWSLMLLKWQPMPEVKG